MRTVVSGGARVNLCCLALEPQLLNHFCKLLILTNIREMLGFTVAVDDTRLIKAGQDCEGPVTHLTLWTNGRL